MRQLWRAADLMNFTFSPAVLIKRMAEEGMEDGRDSSCSVPLILRTEAGSVDIARKD